MNKNIKLAVAGAVLALSATAANAGIVIPAGDWTLDVSGNVNAYSSWSAATSGSTHGIDGGLTLGSKGTTSSTATANGWGNGLLPNFLGFTGTTRQNDLDVSFTISLQPGTAAQNAVGSVQGGGAVIDTGGLNNRQAFITFGDKSWGSVKIGKDLGIFASDAILNDMTLLGVGGAAAGGANTSLGRIGFGYLYADWKPQLAYTTPNFSGFQATVGIAQAFDSTGTTLGAGDVNSGFNNGNNRNASPAYEGKASYSFAANDVTGKVWVSGIAQKVGNLGLGASGANVVNQDPVAYAGDIGANVNAAGFGLTGYYYYGSGIGTTGQFWGGYGYNNTTTASGFSARDSYGGYVQATYVLPTKTKVGVSWGESRLDTADGETGVGALVKSNEMWTVGIYHPLTKHLNLVAEYDYQTSKSQAGSENNANVGSLGAILFF